MKEQEFRKNEDRLRNLWDNFKHTNIQIIGVPKGEEEEQEIKNLFEKIMKENSPNLVKEIGIQVQEAQRIPTKLDTKKVISRLIMIKLPKVKIRRPCLVCLSGLRTSLQTDRSLVSLVQLPVRALAWVEGQVPGWGPAKGNQSMYLSHTDVSLSLSFSLPSPLSKINK